MKKIIAKTQDELSILEAKRAYHKQWRKNNKDKVQAAQNRFYAKIAHEEYTATQK